MKVLSIGNSFSQDAQKYLNKIAELNGQQLLAVNLYIGGCSLEMHWHNVEGKRADYDLEYNGEAPCRKISISEALALEKWDIVTLQQASYDSGRPQSYIPYLQKLVSLIKETNPQAKIYFHQTWSYETGSFHDSFPVYGNNQREMYRRICDATDLVVKLTGISVIPTGTVIQKIRESLPEFDYQNGGLSLCRDTFHLSLDYGRFTAAASWFYTFTGNRPENLNIEGMDSRLLEKIASVVASVN